MTPSSPAALVTGGSGGIGASICRHLLDAGYLVLNLSRRKSSQAQEGLIDVEVDLSVVEETRDSLPGRTCSYAVDRASARLHFEENQDVLEP